MTDGYDGANYLIAGEVERTADLVSSDATNDEITVSGDVTGDLSTSADATSEETQTDSFTVRGDTGIDGDYTLSASPTYDSGADETTLPVNEDVTTDVSSTDADDEIAYDIFKDLAFQQSVTVNDEQNIINADYKKKRHKNKIYGKPDGNLSLDALQAPPGTTEEAMDALRNAKANEDEVLVRRRLKDPDSSTVEVEEAPFLVSSVSENAGDDSAVTFSVDLEQNAKWSTIS